jgi:uncharacterized delta-60 repeat protein
MMRTRTLGPIALLALGAMAIAAGTAGSLDTGFGGDGVVVTPSSPNGYLTAVAVQSDAKIVAVGSDGVTEGVGEWTIRRYLTTGALDTGFGTSGEVRLFGDHAQDSATDVSIDSSGRIVVCGDVMVESGGKGKKVRYDRVMAVVRLSAAGTLDSTFGSGGVVFVDVPDSETEDARAVAIRPDGRIVLAGTARATSSGAGGGKGKGGGSKPTTSTAIAVVRLLGDGSPDTGFGGGDGVLVHDLGPGDEFVIGRAMGLQSNGSIVVGSRDLRGSGWTLTSYTSSGAVDTGFGTVYGASGRQLGGLVVQSDDKIVASGFDTAGDTDAVVVRYHAGGAVDTAFATGGTFHSGLTGRDEAGPVAVQPDGRIAVGILDIPSSTEIDLLALRLNANGSLDSGFGVAGFAEVVDVNEQDGPRALAVAPGGRIVLGGGTVGAATDWLEDWLLVAYRGD